MAEQEGHHLDSNFQITNVCHMLAFQLIKALKKKSVTCVMPTSHPHDLHKGIQNLGSTSLVTSLFNRGSDSDEHQNHIEGAQEKVCAGVCVCSERDIVIKWRWIFVFHSLLCECVCGFDLGLQTFCVGVLFWLYYVPCSAPGKKYLSQVSGTLTIASDSQPRL